MADLDGVGGVDAEQRADTVVHRVVHEGDLVDLRGLADVERVTAAAEDPVHVAGIELEGADLHDIVVVAVEEAGEEVRDFAVDEDDALQDRGTARVLHDAGAGGAVELDVLEV